jgi:acetyltransferase-like isoleucine patch superfamily enzyme/acyl carrier protein
MRGWGLTSPFWRKQQSRFFALGISRRHHLRRKLSFYVVRHGFEIGSYSHGSPDIRAFGSRLIVGKYSSIAKGVTFVLGGQHATRALTTFPMELVCGGEKPASRQELRGDTVVGSDVWIASNALILPGVTIGDGAVVGLGAVVINDVPPYSIVFGNPARVTGKRFSDDVIAELLELRWWDLPHKQVKTLRPLLVETDVEAFFAACRESRGLPRDRPARVGAQTQTQAQAQAQAASARVRADAACVTRSAPAQSHSAAAISAWCVNYLATAMNIPPERIDQHVSFASLGMDSVTRVGFMIELEEALNVDITPDDIVERPTIAQLALYLAQQAREPSESA